MKATAMSRGLRPYGLRHCEDQMTVLEIGQATHDATRRLVRQIAERPETHSKRGFATHSAETGLWQRGLSLWQRSLHSDLQSTFCYKPRCNPPSAVLLASQWKTAIRIAPTRTTRDADRSTNWLMRDPQDPGLL